MAKKAEEKIEKKTYILKVKATFLEELLGTASNNPEIHSEFIASKAPDARSTEEEVAAIGVEEAVEKSMTVFPRNPEGNPILFDYQIKGFFKDSTGALRRVPGTKSSQIKAFKKEIDGLVFVFPRMIPLNMPGPMGECQRPLRASTAMGERIALAHSEAAPAGTTIEFEVQCLTKDMYDLVRELLDYGRLRGIGQWRNSGKGRLTWQELDEEGNVVGGNHDSTASK